MKNYRCVFSYSGGSTTITIAAVDGEQAIEIAAGEIHAGDFDRVEVWEGAVLVVQRTTPRAWDALGEYEERPDASSSHSAPPAGPPPSQATLPGGLQRRPPSLLPGRGPALPKDTLRKPKQSLRKAPS